MSRVRILLADDHEEFLRVFAAFLDKKYDLLGLASDGEELVQLVSDHHPDLILVDISMPRMNGIAAMEKITGKPGAPKCIFVTTHTSPQYVKRAFQIGASGFVLKMHAFEQIEEAIETVLNGKIYLSPQLEQPFPAAS